MCVCVFASQPVSLSTLSSLPRPPPQVTPVKKTKGERAEQDGRGRGRRKKRNVSPLSERVHR